MIDYGAGIGLTAIKAFITPVITEFLQGVTLPESIFVYGIRDEPGRAQIHLAPGIINARQLIEFFEQKGYSVSPEQIGHADRINWLGLSRALRTDHPRECARICLLTDFTVNRLVAW